MSDNTHARLAAELDHANRLNNQLVIVCREQAEQIKNLQLIALELSKHWTEATK